MKFILMAFLLLGNGDPVLTTQEFSSEENCNNAKTILENGGDSIKGDSGTNRLRRGVHVFVYCVPK